MELGYLHHKFLGQPILGKEEFDANTVDANFKRIGAGLSQRNSRVVFLSFLAVDAVLWWVP